jgi:hypothetical protein
MSDVDIKAVGFDLQSYFVNVDVFLTALDEQAKMRVVKSLETASKFHKPGANAVLQSTISNEAKRFIVAKKIVSLEELLVTGQDLLSKYVTIERAFYFKGTSKAATDIQKGLSPSYVDFSARMDEFPDLKISGKLDPQKLTTHTSFSRLERQARVFMLAYVFESSSESIKLRPIIIADKIATSKDDWSGITYYSNQRVAEQINEFQKLNDVSIQSVKLDDLKNYSEKQIKNWFAGIISEPFVPKDWGGEQSDLFTSHIHVDGTRMSAAFLLKGPSHFNVMQIKDLGKNSDQIVRLFDEPADVFILQHCHVVSSAVRNTMEAFASRWFKNRLFVVIDGSDTWRILKAYGKI